MPPEANRNNSSYLPRTLPGPREQELGWVECMRQLETDSRLRVARIARLVAGVFLLMFIVVPVTGSAQDTARTDDSRQDAAREEFRSGEAAALEERWADSERHFRRAFELSGVVAALVNQAVALRALGRHRDARDAFDRALEMRPQEALRSQIQEWRGESAARVAVLVLTGLEPRVTHDVALDGVSTGDGQERPLRLETDSGRHALVVRREGHVPWLWQGDTHDGQSLRLQVEMEQEAQPRSLASHPWFWVLVVSVAAGAAAATGILVRRARQPDDLVPLNPERTLELNP